MPTFIYIYTLGVLQEAILHPVFIVINTLSKNKSSPGNKKILNIWNRN